MGLWLSEESGPATAGCRRSSQATEQSQLPPAGIPSSDMLAIGIFRFPLALLHYATGESVR
jgi:hypothetical protein